MLINTVLHNEADRYAHMRASRTSRIAEALLRYAECIGTRGASNT